MGNLHDEDFVTIWNSPGYQEFRAKMVSSDIPEECTTCLRREWQTRPFPRTLMNEAAMDVSIIIVNLNSRQLLEECLGSIYKHTRDIEFETIVVDNASSDGSQEMVKTTFPQVHLIENSTNNRYAIANNQGLEIAQGKYVFYLNGDTVLTRQFP